MMKEIAKRGLSLLLSVVMALSMMPVLDLHQHAHAATLTGLDSSLSDLTLTYTDATNSGTLSWAPSGTSITGSIKNNTTYKSGWSTYYYGSDSTLTIKYTGDGAATLAFKYSASVSKGSTAGWRGDVFIAGTRVAGEEVGVQSVSDQSFTTTVYKNDTITIKIVCDAINSIYSTRPNSNVTLSGITLTPIVDNPDVTYQYDSSLGSVTLNGATVTSGTTGEMSGESAAALVAIPNSGVTFIGWTDGTGAILSASTSYSLATSEDMTVKAVFAKDGSTPIFMVGGASKGEYKDASGAGLIFASTATYYTINGTHLFEGFDAAASFASASSGSKYMVLMNNATLSAGTYTIPSGVTLLIPFDSANTLYTGTPCSTPEGEYATPTAFRTLTLANGAELVVNGALSVSGKHLRTVTGPCAGSAPTGPVGFINTEGGSKITVNNGGTLYANVRLLSLS